MIAKHAQLKGIDTNSAWKGGNTLKANLNNIQYM